MMVRAALTASTLAWTCRAVRLASIRRARSAGGAGCVLASLAMAMSLALGADAPGDPASFAWPHERPLGTFRIHADFDLAEVETALHELAQLPRDVGETLQIPWTHQRIDVFLFHDQASFDRYLTWLVPQATRRSAMFVQHGDALLVFAYRRSELAGDLRHECTHALLHSRLRGLPLWIDEGLAEYFERLPAERDKVRSTPMASVTTSELARLTEPAQMTGRHYEQAQAWVHAMLHGSPHSANELRRYLQKHLRRGSR